ncbi:unnamed protein product [Timema podura]|uniref:Uncharacterized protein n=1 Tax=Timema podura TaxID=61482 RepID=A0ABN7P824_TIMPD|nr:unnamed protein product [Timema podura]
MKSLYDGFLPIKEQVKNESDSSDYEDTMVKNEMKYDNSSLGIMEITRDQFIPEIKSQVFMHNQHCTSGSCVGTSQRSTEVDESCGTLLENRSLPCAGGLHAVYHHHQNGDLLLLGQDIGLP